jgi:hypothetical protein
MCKIFQKIDEIVRRFVYWIAYFGLVWAFMSWVAAHITWISKYGWGVVVFAGVGAACVVMLVVCGVLITWRYFNPLPEQSMTGESLETNLIESRRVLISQARDFVSRTIRLNPDSTYFEKQLTSDQIFYRLRPYLSDQFKMVLNASMSGRMASYPSSRMPVIAARFIDEIERLEREWNLT